MGMTVSRLFEAKEEMVLTARGIFEQKALGGGS
jgi:hypothetical protein